MKVYTDQVTTLHRGFIIWFASVICLLMAVTGRTSFGVAGVAALDHFSINASQLAVFTTVQIGVYAFAQVPMGYIIDHYGPRKILLWGAIFMALGQIILALTSHFYVALIGRVFIGLGDATAFLSVMRLIPEWIPLKKAPLYTQLTGSIGQLGQFLSAIPFATLLGLTNWTTAFISLGAICGIFSIAAALIVRDSPHPKKADAHKVHISDQLKRTLPHSVVWQAFFLHWSGTLIQIVFTMLWAIPLMTLGMGISQTAAQNVLVINTIAMIIMSPFLGIISTKAGKKRYLVNIAFSGAVFIAWIIFFASSEPRGLISIIILNIFMAALAPVSNYGFDTERETLSPEILGTATGFANMGAWMGTMIANQFFGVVLNSKGDYSWHSFQSSAWVVGLCWLVAIIAIVLLRLKKDSGIPQDYN